MDEIITGINGGCIYFITKKIESMEWPYGRIQGRHFQG